MVLIEKEPQNLENEFLLGLQNQTVIADVFAQIRAKSKFLPKIKTVQVDGDVFKVVGLKSNEPKQFSWNYKEQEFGPNEVASYKGRIEDKDKLIFYTVFSESIEQLALGGKAPTSVALQTQQLSSKVASFYDKELVLNYFSDDKRYHKEAIIQLTASQLQDVQLVAKILITAGFQMTTPSRKFNLKEDECNVEDTKKIFCCLNYPLYSAMITSSLHTSPSPILATLREIFDVIPVNMANGMQTSLIDSDGIFLAQGLNKRYLKLDEYVAAHKLLDHIWRKWVLVDFRPAFAIKCDDALADISDLLNNLGPTKDILKDYGELKDKDDETMREEQANEWNDADFTYEQVKDWIEVGVLTSEAEFATWMRDTKAKENIKFKDYGDPKWCLENLGKNDHKGLDELKEESKA
ncbi:protein of unknown function [endosymbiont DhMRE of Dentiscutata heterogama]|uniref:hypothetical protein n=1 Tax=endosymbiont DhMRE of Dentiscutata heterogama TaxID=1609546 RepID=UPI000629D9EA|nr:hypothetical protein [endosymbiont DhMRE of Dentiscutata heterogama]CFW92956.1 protein of unknown function [endosymbiont DhMRE of Dentiscutata heterogama]